MGKWGAAYVLDHRMGMLPGKGSHLLWTGQLWPYVLLEKVGCIVPPLQSPPAPCRRH